MKKTKALAALLAATSTVGSAGLTASAADTADFEINPAINADGNYNILFITTDQEHYFSRYPEGTEYQARLLLEELGTTFEKHYACSNMSTSSRSVIYTGTHITDTEMLDNTDFPWQSALDEDKVTIGDRLRDAGLYTAYKGKWHMGDTSVLMETESEPIDMEAYGFSDWDTDKDYIGEAQEGYMIDPVIVADSVEWLKSKGKPLNEAGQSFFLAVNLINPHDIMNYPTQDGFVGRTMELAEAPDNKVYEKSYDQPLPSTWQQDPLGENTAPGVSGYANNWFGNMGSIDQHNFGRLQDYYFNCIQDSDNNLMTLLSELDNMHLLDNTIIVFTSDHGEMQGAHGLKGKGGFVYDYNIHVPLVIYHPDYEGGRRVSAVTSHIDLAPTFIDMTGLSAERKAEVSAGLSGHSLMPLIDGSAESVRDGALFCYEMLSMAMTMQPKAEGGLDISIDNRGFVRAIITEDYKFARYFSPFNFNTPESFDELIANNSLELYDLKNDPEEMNNLALDPEANRELIMELNAKLNELIAKEVGIDDGHETVNTMDGIDEKLMMFAKMLAG